MTSKDPKHKHHEHNAEHWSKKDEKELYKALDQAEERQKHHEQELRHEIEEASRIDIQRGIDSHELE
ncbi:hypothetical protein HK103_001837 [Boothiomyces macroporosus]|uniref:Uncharacterized protein n=1 Tax=Boothiomyces macroporosus TaxID=261099 RepID=A0AAD5UAE0_9FUNG|nr:hypothetical protein HK103_001837 [Boothiomyces macroporosus]